MMKNILLLLSLVAFSSCAVGPLMLQESARTSGKGEGEVSGTYGLAGYAIKLNIGMTENFDWGFQLESLSFGTRLKYALMNNSEKGFSLAVAGGTGWSVGGTHYYGDVIGSHLSGNWEPYGAVRYVQVKTSDKNIKDANNDQTLFVIQSERYNYAQYFVGIRYWADKVWSVTGEASWMTPVAKGIEFKTITLLSAGIGYKF